MVSVKAPAWFISVHFVRLESEVSVPAYKLLYYELKQSYLQYHEIFTDGSKAGDKVSSACIFIDSQVFTSNKPSPSYQHLHR